MKEEHLKICRSQSVFKIDYIELCQCTGRFVRKTEKGPKSLTSASPPSFYVIEDYKYMRLHNSFGIFIGVKCSFLSYESKHILYG